MSNEDTGTITELLLAWGQGDRNALAKLMPLVHEQMHGMARNYLRGERGNHTLQSRALVNEAYLRLVDLERVNWNDRAHFYAITAQTMRRILVDHARHVGRLKRGGDQAKVPIDEAHHVSVSGGEEDLERLDDALRDLAERDAEQAKIVELRYFGGLNRDEIAHVLGISSATVSRRWRMARAWLYRALADGAPDGL